MICAAWLAGHFQAPRLCGADAADGGFAGRSGDGAGVFVGGGNAASSAGADCRRQGGAGDPSGPRTEALGQEAQSRIRT